MAVIVSLGDLSAITLFGSDRLVTLPALIFRQMGHYRMNDAAGTALVLAAFQVRSAAFGDTVRLSISVPSPLVDLRAWPVEDDARPEDHERQAVGWLH
jgi:hypothetical protein